MRGAHWPPPVPAFPMRPANRATPPTPSVSLCRAPRRFSFLCLCFRFSFFSSWSFLCPRLVVHQTHQGTHPWGILPSRHANPFLCLPLCARLRPGGRRCTEQPIAGLTSLAAGKYPFALSLSLCTASYFGPVGEEVRSCVGEGKRPAHGSCECLFPFSLPRESSGNYA